MGGRALSCAHSLPPPGPHDQGTLSATWGLPGQGCPSAKGAAGCLGWGRRSRVHTLTPHKHVQTHQSHTPHMYTMLHTHVQTRHTYTHAPCTTHTCALARLGMHTSHERTSGCACTCLLAHVRALTLMHTPHTCAQSLCEGDLPSRRAPGTAGTSSSPGWEVPSLPHPGGGKEERTVLSGACTLVVEAATGRPTGQRLSC